MTTTHQSIHSHMLTPMLLLASSLHPSHPHPHTLPSPAINRNNMGILFSFFHKVKNAFIPVDDKDEVWLLDNIAYPNHGSPSSSQWTAEYVVAFFKENESTRARIGTTIANILQTLQIAPGEAVRLDAPGVDRPLRRVPQTRQPIAVRATARGPFPFVCGVRPLPAQPVWSGAVAKAATRCVSLSVGH